jgi:hypothetical protein
MGLRKTRFIRTSLLKPATLKDSEWTGDPPGIWKLHNN